MVPYFNSKATTPTSCFDDHTLQGPLANDQIYDPNMPAELWDCIEAIIEQLQMDEPLTPEFRLRSARQLQSISYERVMRANRFCLLHWALKEQERQARELREERTAAANWSRS